MLKLNVGSGQRKFGDGWINVDCQAKWEPDIVADGALMSMFADGSADMIVLHHVLEHFGCGEAGPLVSECHRILKPGGSLIVTVPDMRELATGWLKGRVSAQIYMTNVYGAYMNDEADRHKWGYNVFTLRSFLLSCCEWSGLHKFDFRPIEGADIAGPEWWILGMEAVK